MPGSIAGRRFPATRASAVLGVRSAGEAERARAWDALIAAYWRPVYAHLRLRWNKSRDDAADLTQAFFAYAHEKSVFESYDPSRARFRTFVRVCVDRFAGHEEQARRRLKRGGAFARVPLDLDLIEADLPRVEDPETIFDREWTRALFALAVDALRAHCEATGKEKRFAVFERYDLPEHGARPTYAELGRALGLTESSVTNHLAWARRELRRLLLEHLAELTASDSEYRSEAQALFGVDAG